MTAAPMTSEEKRWFGSKLCEALDREWRSARDVYERAFPMRRYDTLEATRTYAALRAGMRAGTVERMEVPNGKRTYCRWRLARWPHWTSWTAWRSRKE